MYKEAAYLYLCEQMGEDLMLFFTNERGDAEKGEPLISAEAVCRMFESRVTDEIKEQYPESLYRPIARMDGQNAPGRIFLSAAIRSISRPRRPRSPYPR